MFTALKDFIFGTRSGSTSASSTSTSGSHGRSKVLARSRLHFVLVQDRTGLSPEEMTRFKREMVGVIERYFEIDEKGFDITYKRDSDTTTLLINSPVIVRRKSNLSLDAEGDAEASEDHKIVANAATAPAASTDAEAAGAVSGKA